MRRIALVVASSIVLAGCGVGMRVARRCDSATSEGDVATALSACKSAMWAESLSARRREEARQRFRAAVAQKVRGEIRRGRDELAAGRHQAAYDQQLLVLGTVHTYKWADHVEETEAAFVEAALALAPPSPTPPNGGALERRWQAAERLFQPLPTESRARAPLEQAKADVSAFWRAELDAAGSEPGARVFPWCALRTAGLPTVGADPRLALGQPVAPRWDVQVSGKSCAGVADMIQRRFGPGPGTGPLVKLRVDITDCEMAYREEQVLERHEYTVTIPGEPATVSTKRDCRDAVRYENNSGVSDGSGISSTTRIDYEVCSDVSYEIAAKPPRVEKRAEEVPTIRREARLVVRGTARAEWPDGRVSTVGLSGDPVIVETREWHGQHSEGWGVSPSWDQLASSAVETLVLWGGGVEVFRGTQLAEAEGRAAAGDVRQRDAAYVHVARAGNTDAAAAWFGERYGFPNDEARTILGCEYIRFQAQKKFIFMDILRW